MARRSSPRPYFQRVSVPGMAPHFEPMGPPTEDGFLEPAPRPARAPRWRLHWPAMPRLAMPQIGRRAWQVLGAAAGLAAAALALQHMPPLPSPSLGWTPWSSPQAPEPPAAPHPLRLLLNAVDDCRGAESLMVMLPAGDEREVALDRMQRQQRQIGLWLRENAAWLAAAHGSAALVELRAAVGDWQQLQRRIADAEVVDAVNGHARESRSLMAGPSAEAYRRVVALLDRLQKAQRG